MHSVSVRPDVLEQALRRRGGRPHLFHPLDPARTAHLVIDLQNGFMEPGAPIEVPNARDVVPNVNAISRALRDLGGSNVFLRFTLPPDALGHWSSFFGRFGAPQALAYQQLFAPGAHCWTLWPGLNIGPGEACLDKERFSAFVPGTCDLQNRLRDRGIDTLIISGAMTNCCCESTARDAMQLDYKVIFVSDATATLSDSDHNATLNNMASIFADVLTTDELLGALGQQALNGEAP